MALVGDPALGRAQKFGDLERSGFSDLGSVRVGDDVALRMIDGRDRFGTVLEIDADVIVIDTGAGVLRLAHDDVKSCERYPHPSCCSAPAWSRNPDLPVIWFAGGLGNGRTDRSSRGTYGAIEGTIPFRGRRFVMARWSRYDEHDANRPRERGETVGLSLGAMARGSLGVGARGHWMVDTSAGLGYTRGISRGTLLDEGFPLTRDRYRRIDYRAIGVLAEARTALTWRFGGIGIAVLGDANPECQTIGAQGFVFVGLMPPAVRREAVP